MNCVVRQVTDRMPGKELERLSVYDLRFEINQLLFLDDTALVADSEEKLCIFMSEFGTVLRVNVV